MPGLQLGMNPEQQLIKNEDDQPDHDDFLLDDEDGDGGSYKPRPQLSQPAVLMRTLAHLMQGLETGNIDVDPDYQREVVWTAERMSGLINSLMENYYIPPIILNKKEVLDQPSKYIMVCVDGKQRLSSVRAFVKGMIHCNDHRGEKWWFCDKPNARSRKVLPEETQKQFLAKEFVSFEFANLTPGQEEDLFGRVQKGMELTSAEKMRASTGPWQELAKLYVEHFPAIVSLMKDRSRAKDFQLILACFSQILECLHPSTDTGIPVLRTTYTTLPKFLENRHLLDDDMKSHLGTVFRTFNDLIKLDPDVFTNAERKLKGVQTFAPIEMVAIAVLISMYSDTRNNRLLLGDIRHLRNSIREKFVDLRMNRSLWKYLWDYIDNLEQVRGAVDGSTVDRSLITANTAGRLPTMQNQPATPNSQSQKRGRQTAITKQQMAIPATTVPARAEPSMDSHQRKKPRVDPDLNVSSIKQEPANVSPFLPFPTAPTSSSTGSGTTSLSSRAVTSPHVAQQSPATFATQTLAASLPGNQNPLKSQTSRVPYTAQHQRPSNARPASQSSFTPGQPQYDRSTNFNGYRAPFAQMESTAIPQPKATQAPTMLPYGSSILSSNMQIPTRMPPSFVDGYLADFLYYPPPSSSHPAFPSNPAPNPPASRTPVPTPSSASHVPIPMPVPARQAQSRLQPRPQPRIQGQDTQHPRTLSSTHQLKTSAAPPTAERPQSDGANDPIDLTSDTEQERVTLLTAFRPRATNEKVATRSDTLRTAGSTKKDSIVVPDSSQDLPIRKSYNPYKNRHGPPP